jgi:hypothetical protein
MVVRNGSLSAHAVYRELSLDVLNSTIPAIRVIDRQEKAFAAFRK